MQSISRSLRFCRHRCASVIASGAPRGYPPALARRGPLNQAASVLPAKRFAHEPYLTHHAVVLRSEKRQLNFFTTEGMDKPRKEIDDVHDSESTAADDTWPADRICHAQILKNSSHRDGAINKGNWGSFLMDITDRNETVLELKKVSKGQPCYPDEENCMCHLPSPMIQIFALRLAKTPIDSGPMQLYGYMAARDDMDGLLNYVFNHSRDNPVIVQQGSLLEMTGPRRGILTLSDVLMEFDMRIKTAEREEDDLQLIDGIIHLDQLTSTSPFILRINGSCGGAVDMCLTLVEDGMEAIIEVVVSQVQEAFDLSLSSIVSFTTGPKEFQLFHGAVGELSIKRFVVAVPMDAMMHLKFKVGEKGSGDVHYCSFSSKQHGCVNRQIDLEVACISVKVTVSAPWL